ncbi:hypothetical protein ACLBWX_04700 [Methylobacterium sp. M6A4_1b]
MRAVTLIAVLGIGLPGMALAQQSDTESNLNSAGQFRSITSTGVTKPPGRAEAPSEDRLSETTRKQQAIDRKVETGICIGCN